MKVVLFNILNFQVDHTLEI